MSKPIYAGIDCGTNSTRLIIGDGEQTFEREMTITGLGRGVDSTGMLSPEGIERVRAALENYRTIMDRYDIVGTRMTATSAARDASNRDEFFAVAEATVGVTPELISGHEEAELSFLGATAELDPADGPFLVFDIGGGSTEFAYGGDTFQKGISTDMGCVRLTEQHIHSDPSLPEELVAALSIAELHLDDVVAAIPEAPSATTLVGLAGTVSATAAIEQGLAEYDRDRIHHFVLTKDAVEDVFRTLATEDREDRLANPGMEEGRVDVIVGGLCVLVRIMRQFEFDRCLVSEADILDGLAMSLL